MQNLARYPWILIPGVFIFLAVMSFNFLGDHLRDRLDPSNRIDRPALADRDDFAVMIR